MEMKFEFNILLIIYNQNNTTGIAKFYFLFE